MYFDEAFFYPFLKMLKEQNDSLLKFYKNYDKDVKFISAYGAMNEQDIVLRGVKLSDIVDGIVLRFDAI